MANPLGEEDVSKKLLCAYCGEYTELVTGKEIYPKRKDLHERQFYLCRPCDAWVGVHQGTTEPLGRVANAGLRKAKMLAHAAFDPLWRPRSATTVKRKEAYAWLAKALGITEEECHIGQFDIQQCEAVVHVCNERRRGRKLMHTLGVKRG